MHNKIKQILTFVVLNLILIFSVQAEDRSTVVDLPDDLTEVGLENLLNFDVVVTSASKKKQKLSEVASGIYILTEEDIRRSGANHIVEVLRLVPGLNVARINTNDWAVTSRGFNSSRANKLLTLIDGRIIYNTLFNGTFWEQEELVLEDIKRIEVIRGPGAALWGANAVNGVINIITKHAEDTQGLSAVAGFGSEEKYFGSLRYGGKLGDRTSYRAYSRYSFRDDSEFISGGKAKDDFEVVRSGIRTDTRLSENEALMLTAEGFYVREKNELVIPSLNPPFVETEGFSGNREHFGVSLNSNYTREYSKNSDLQIRGDYYFEDRGNDILPTERHVLSFEGQHRFSPLEDHDLIYGVGYRLHSDDVQNTFADALSPDSRTMHLFTAFFHDEVTLSEKVKLILGSKFEENDHTGFEVMPNARLLWQANQSNTLWASVSRAVAVPSRIFDDVSLPVAIFPSASGSGATRSAVTIFGDREVDSDVLIAYELGFRRQASSQLFFDVTAFFNDYTKLQGFSPGRPFLDTDYRGSGRSVDVIPLVFDSVLEAHTYGVEFVVEWEPYNWWKLVGTYSFLEIDVDEKDSGDTFNPSNFEGNTPEQQFHIRSQVDIGEKVEFDTVLRYVDDIVGVDIGSYFGLDLRLGYKVNQNIEFALIGTNLIEESHTEFASSIFPPPLSEIERAAFVKLTWNFQ